jgi:hypothetical protein
VSQPLAARPAAAPREGGHPLAAWRAAVYLLLFSTASLAWIGYRFGGGNHSVQIPILKHYMDRSLYARDLLVASIDGYTTYFFPLMAPLARAAGQVELPYFAVYFVFHAATLAAVYALSLLLFGRRGGALVACALYLLNPLSLAGESSLASRLQHGHVATPLLLWALYLYLRGRLLPAFALCGLAANLHGLYACYVLAMMGLDATVRWRVWRAPRLLAALGLFVLLALPALLWMAGSGQGLPSGTEPLWLEILRERSALHTFPLAQPADVYGKYVLLLAVGVLGWAGAEASPHRRTCLHFALAVAVLCLAGLLFAEWRPLPLVLRAQLLRSTKWLTYLVILYVADLFVRSWGGGMAARAASVACALALVLQEPSWLAVGLVLYLLGATRRWGVPVVGVGAAALLAAARTGAAALPEGGGLPQLGTRLAGLLADPWLVACFGLFLVIRATASRRGENAALALAAAAVLFYVLPGLYRDSVEATRAQSWNEVQAWVRDHTPPEAVVLTPPYRDGFRVFSERSIVGEWKDGTQQFFDAAFAFEWRRRMAQLKGDTRDFDTFDTATLLALGREYGAAYLVVPGRVRHPLPRLFHNSVAAVYALGPAPPPPAGTDPPP